MHKNFVFLFVWWCFLSCYVILERIPKTNYMVGRMCARGFTRRRTTTKKDGGMIFRIRFTETKTRESQDYTVAKDDITVVSELLQGAFKNNRNCINVSYTGERTTPGAFMAFLSNKTETGLPTLQCADNMGLIALMVWFGIEAGTLQVLERMCTQAPRLADR